MAERKTLSVEAGGNTYELRVTMAGQLAIRKACRTPNALKGFGVALDGDPEAICEIFKAALTWAGNENSVKDGAAFYDILVDAGYDEVSMDKLLLDVAATSGIMSAAQADVLKKRLDGLDDEVKSKKRITPATHTDEGPIPEERLIKEARIAGVGFFDVYDMTAGELNEWIDAVAERQRRDAQVQSIIAYRQAMLTADAVLTKMNGVNNSYDPIDWFPFWTAEERAQVKKAQLMQMIERQKQAIIANSDYAEKQKQKGGADGTDI